MGDMQVYQDERNCLYALDWIEYTSRSHQYFDQQFGAEQWQSVDTPANGSVIEALTAYLSGELAAITALKVHTQGTPFQLEIWKLLQEIPTGETRTYGDLARQVSNIGASRSVGAACGANPIAIVIPCHRVVGANQSMTGYASGVERKNWLLRHENALRLEQLSLF
ncbi:MAG: methylated-DNA-[protein]-cysteine S-methyltransferase [Parasphingorhabdus sp.]|jgi:methylated-DNA-[protein]-cysteine S-methyltransferase